MIINNWKMNFEDKVNVPCTAPCSMYGVLFENGYIPDPFYGTNELELRHLSRKDCTFHTEFSLSDTELSRERIELIFHGLDTICKIYLNGALLDSVMNMHRTYEYDVKGMVGKNNTLRLEFSSPIEYFETMNNKHYLYNTSDSVKGVAHLRKALYMSGWDWGPTLPDMGIFRPVELRAYDCDKFSDVMIRQHHKDGKVTLAVTAEAKYGIDGERITVTADGKTVELHNGEAEIVIDEPRLWWPRGYGDQPLYDVEFVLENRGKVIDTVKKTVGLRTLTVSTAEVAGGNEFCFVVNGVKIFAKGANYIPLDNIISRITPQRIERTIEDCCFANFNCVRVWGGGYYPEDHFFDLCDRAGLVVWQDFMIACINVWMRPDFEREITLEAIDNIKRIRHHACLGLLCGNNEMEDALCNWGLPDNMLVKMDYIKLYEQLLPALCDKYAPDTFYLSSSPTSGGGFDKPQDPSRGDVHFWAVWNQGKPFDEYRKHKFRFCSEYGFESLPSVKTIDYFCPPEERNLLSYTMENHQKHKNGNAKILSYLAAEYEMPATMENLVYASQLNQGTAIKYGVEHFRRTRGYCMGSIYWQLNDCWPVSSWSSVDSFGRYKALHYFARRFYAPVAIGLFAENGKITVNLANETMSGFKGVLKVCVTSNTLETSFSDETEVSVAALTSSDVASYSLGLMSGSRERCFTVDLYDENGSFIMRQTELGTKPKYFKWKKPSFTVRTQTADGGVYLDISADVLAKNVEVSFATHDLVLSDNYFDISTAEPVRIFVKTDLSAAELEKDMRLKSVYDIPLP